MRVGHVLAGARICWHAGDLLVASLNTPGAVYAVNARGCSCANGRAGRAACWHVELYEQLLAMRDTAAETADLAARISAARRTSAYAA